MIISLRDNPEPSVKASGLRSTPASFRKALTTSRPASSLVRIVIASAAMSAAAYFSYYLLTNYFVEKPLFIRVVEAFVPILLAIATFLIAAKLLGIGELTRVVSAVQRKLGGEK